MKIISKKIRTGFISECGYVGLLMDYSSHQIVNRFYYRLSLCHLFLPL